LMVVRPRLGKNRGTSSPTETPKNVVITATCREAATHGTAAAAAVEP